jgi:predicted porin
MNKTLLAVAVSAAMVASTAAVAGDVVVYGQAQVEVASYSEDLGNGLKGIAQFEFKADASDNTVDNTSGASLSGRVSQVGLSGGFGTVVLGNLKSPYKYTGGVKYDPFVTTALEARKNGGMTSGALGHNGFVSNLVAYASPKGPVTASVGYGPSEDDGLVALDVKYSQGGVEAFVAYVDAGDRLNGGVAGDDTGYSATKVGGQWKSGPHKISGQYEMTEATDAANNKVEPTVLFLGYQMKMGKNTFVAQYGDTDHDTTADNTTYMALGVIHKFTKMTRLYAGYRDTSDVENVVTVGLRKDFR